MRSSPSGAPRPSNSCLDEAQVIHHQYHPRSVGYEGRQGIFYAMKQFVGSTCRLTWGALLAILLMFAASRPVCAQAPPEQQGPPLISTVEVQYVGPQTISREKVLAQIRTRPGQPYSESLVEQDIKALYKSGQVDRKSTRLNSSHSSPSRMPSSA